ncbi:MAG: hypothetical protein Hyperionvirus6_31 [Hyperionvirus sp.]|uniref:Leucine-rich repeat protein n=1 Tax=Hyperionvirus sp. TaxID=2487770 RepID=A0A3G5A7U6_9VIRU|nr:MAG: hypothetical protein Hyperionvirus6_31 [Hyperionvirus sp.]
MATNFKKRRSLPKLVLNKFDSVPFEVLCSFLYLGEMFNLMMVSKMIRVKVYKVGSSHAKVKNFDIAQRLMAKFPKITLRAPNILKKINDSQIITLTRLVELRCDYSMELTDACLKHLINLTKLRFLGSIFSEKAIMQLPKIKSLSIHENTTIEDIHMKPLTSITELSISGCQISDIGLTYLKNLRKLDLLGSWQNNITGRGLRVLTQLNSLALNNYTNNISEIDLIRLTNLRELKIIAIRFTYDFLSYMTFLEKLTIRDETNPWFTADISFKNTHRLTSLSVIDNCGITGKTFGKLVHLKHLVLRETQLNGKYLRNLRGITHLEIGCNKKIKREHLVNLVSVKTLVLFLDRANNISDEMVGELKNVEVIKIICDNYFFWAISVEAFKPLKNLKKVIVTNKYDVSKYEKFFDERGVELLRL